MFTKASVEERQGWMGPAINELANERGEDINTVVANKGRNSTLRTVASRRIHCKPPGLNMADFLRGESWTLKKWIVDDFKGFRTKHLAGLGQLTPQPPQAPNSEGEDETGWRTEKARLYEELSKASVDGFIKLSDFKHLFISPQPAHGMLTRAKDPKEAQDEEEKERVRKIRNEYLQGGLPPRSRRKATAGASTSAASTSGTQSWATNNKGATKKVMAAKSCKKHLERKKSTSSSSSD